VKFAADFVVALGVLEFFLPRFHERSLSGVLDIKTITADEKTN
jgi:hypothetical protein